jgi:hypothetical protein
LDARGDGRLHQSRSLAPVGGAAVIPLAHLGHWYVSLPIFLGPVLVLLAWVYVGDWLERRRRGDGDED